MLGVMLTDRQLSVQRACYCEEILVLVLALGCK